MVEVLSSCRRSLLPPAPEAEGMYQRNDETALFSNSDNSELLIIVIVVVVGMTSLMCASFFGVQNPRYHIHKKMNNTFSCIFHSICILHLLEPLRHNNTQSHSSNRVHNHVHIHFWEQGTRTHTRLHLNAGWSMCVCMCVWAFAWFLSQCDYMITLNGFDRVAVFDNL